MKFKRGRTSRAVAYLMSTVMISQALLSPVSTVYASAVDDDASQQVAAETEKGNVGSSDGSSNGQDTGTDDTTVTDDASSSHTSASADNAAEQSEVASTPANDAAGQSEVASRSVDGYNPNAEPIVIDSNTKPGSASVTAGFYKDKDYTQELGTEALGVHQTVYGMVNI